MTVTIDNVVAGTAVVDALGAWTFVPTTPLPDGSHSVSAHATDPAGNIGTESMSAAFVVDTQAPASPVVTSPTAGGTTSNPPTFTGTAEAGSFVAVVIDGVVVATVLTDSSGNWSYVSPSPIADGSHTISAVATDRAGNESAPSSPMSFTTVSPAADGGVDGGADAGVTDGGMNADGGVTDGGATDAGTSDGGMSDAGMPSDGGLDDAGMSDAGSTDAGQTDGGPDAGSQIDAGIPDGGSDITYDLAGGGCGCSTPGVDAPWVFALFGALLRFKKRRASHRA